MRVNATWGGCPCQRTTLYVDPCLPPFLSQDLACCCVQQASWLTHSRALSCLHCSALQKQWSRTRMLASSSLCEFWVFTSGSSGLHSKPFSHSSVSLTIKTFPLCWVLWPIPELVCFGMSLCFGDWHVLFVNMTQLIQ